MAYFTDANAVSRSISTDLTKAANKNAWLQKTRGHNEGLEWGEQLTTVRGPVFVLLYPHNE